MMPCYQSRIGSTCIAHHSQPEGMLRKYRTSMAVHTTQSTLRFLLKECLSFQDGQRFLQSSDFSLTAALSLSVWFHLLIALLVKAVQVLIDGVKLSLNPCSISAGLFHCFIKVRRLLAFVFYIFF